jgi:hypothetical protein
LGAVAGDLLSEFNNNAMVDDTVNGSGCGHGIFLFDFKKSLTKWFSAIVKLPILR